jgi:anti-anti-sigma factor
MSRPGDPIPTSSDGPCDLAELTGVLVLGDLTAATSRALHRRLRRAVEGGARHLRVGLHDVRDVDAAGVAVLLVYARLLPPLGGRLEIVSASPQVQAVLAGMHLGWMLPAPGTVDRQASGRA